LLLKLWDNIIFNFCRVTIELSWISVQTKALFLDQGKYTLTQPKDFLLTEYLKEGRQAGR